MTHTSVMLKECIDALQIKENGIYIDGTLGRGGHSAAILAKLADGHLYAFDRDREAIALSEARLRKISDAFTLIHANFSQMKAMMEAYHINEVDGILLDLGVSSPQFDEAQRGFSYRFDARLDMRMDQGQSLSAWEVVNQWDADQLSDIFYRYGDEKFARVIARAIERQRKQTAINTTWELVDVIKQALPQRELRKKGHPAKRVFQAIRIAVNDEMGELTKVLEDGLSLLKPGGRFCVISFHSLEDRIVKHTFVQVSSAPNIDKRIPVLAKDLPQAPYRIITKKAIVASMEEQNQNHRAHSAKLRVLERI